MCIRDRASFACLTLLLAVPSYQAVISGKDADPLVNVLNSAFGTVGARVVMGVVLISFLSCAISLQAAAGRMTYSYGRDQMIVGHQLWAKFLRAAAHPAVRAAARRGGAGGGLCRFAGLTRRDQPSSLRSRSSASTRPSRWSS